MNENSKVQLAMEIAARAHKGQVDKLGQDYIKHPMRVHRNLLTHPGFQRLNAQKREDLQVAALLHDVIEDSGKGKGSEKFTKEDLFALGFTPRSIELTDLLTRRSHIPSDEYYANIDADEHAKLVKWSDIADNRNVERVSKLDEEKATRLKAKYEHALEIIVMSETDKTWLRDATHLPVDIEWELANESAEAESDLATEQDVYPEVDEDQEEG
ncbi:MAG: hypothetical protein RLZZ56_1243 [Actinomycetota bacterium]|jgi:hypothetical protein